MASTTHCIASYLIARVLVLAVVQLATCRFLDGYTDVNDNDLALSNSSFVLLGGVLPIHPAKGNGTCGPVDASNLQRAEAIAFAVNKVNAESNLLPSGIKLAFIVRDSCLSVNTALDVTFDLASFGRSTCNVVNGTSYGVSGIIGETESTISIDMASLLRLFQIPQVSPFSTASALSDKTLYPYFLRIPPPDNYQSTALVDLVVYFNWTYIITINSRDTYGRDGINQFTKILNSRNGNGTVRCVAASIEISFPTPSQSEFDNAAATFMNPLVVNASAVVLFGHYATAVGLLDALKRHNVTRRLFWVGSDSWGDSLGGIFPKLVSNLVSVVPKTFPSEEFDSYFESLNIYNHTSNPWFAEYWQAVFNCSLQTLSSKSLKPCNATNERISSLTGYVQDSYVPFVIDAVYAYAYSIRTLQMDMCNGSGLCMAIRSTGNYVFIPGNVLKPYLFSASFPSQLGGSNFTFDKNGDPTSVLYTIKNLQFLNDTFSYVSVGTWSNANLSSPLTFTRPVVWNNYQGSIVSRCSEPCLPGHYRSYISDCCYSCIECAGQKGFSDGTSTSCSQCDEKFVPNQFRNACAPIYVSYYNIDSPWPIIISVITCVGILTTIFVAVIFIIFHTHKVVKATGRELISFLLAGILLCYVVPFAYVIKPSAAICATRWCGACFSFSITFSALLIRTIRTHRIFNHSISTKKIAFVGPASQVVFTLIVIGVQVMIVMINLLAEHPGVRYIYSPTTGEILCNESPYVGFSMTLGYNFFLLILTTYFAFRIRHVPKNFNETRYINVTVYSLVIIWVVLLPTYFGTASLGAFYQTTSLLLTIVLSASVVLGAIFVPKVVYLFQDVCGGVQHSATIVEIGFPAEPSSAKPH